MKRCCECKHWKVNSMTAKTGMGLCPKKKVFMSYQEVCPQYHADKVSTKR